jgi:hypothetical protein
MSQDYSVQTILDLACAAQRLNGSYLKETTPFYSDDGKILGYKWANKMLIITTLDPTLPSASHTEFPPPILKPTMEDRVLAENIKLHFRKFMFTAVDGTNDFATSINSILTGDTVDLSQFGYVACLPSTYIRDVMQTRVKKAAKTTEGYLADIGENITDTDAEIIESIKSKNFEGYNICAIINNNMASWISKTDLAVGPCVIVKAKVKDHSKHWKHDNPVTRLNYVKAAQ